MSDKDEPPKPAIDATTEMVAKDAWMEGRDFRPVLAGNDIANSIDEDSGLPMHDRIEWEWVFEKHPRKR